MSTEKPSQKSSRPQLVKLDRAFKLAEQWVNNMTKSVEDESTEVVLEARPPRLGLGAAVPRQSHFAPTNDPVERKLRAKLDAEKRKVAKSAEESTRDESVDEESADEESESRTKAFSRKRAVNLTSSLQANKKQK
ncbi:hypothetical protein RJ639_030585 [Escallonia herrerae]|uniref:Uncharacterized protein n=1 Tax=Escallonia herrerae TaxID=1293975 RepID=A0AA88X4A8_9ASTE|nr:hypothetical protein RJ639_030585 [Escallonia herrerae]